MNSATGENGFLARAKKALNTSKNAQNNEKQQLTDADKYMYEEEFLKEEYYIKYNINGGSVETSNPSKYKSVTPDIILNNPVKEGYDFLGWTGTDLTNETMNVVISKGSTGNREYTAVYSSKTFKINFNSNRGTTYSSINKKCDETYENLPTPSRYLYSFEGWYTESNFKNKVQNSTKVKGDTTLYAKWIPRTFNGMETVFEQKTAIKFNGAGKNVTGEESQKYNNDYIMTYVPLYNSDFYKYDFEVGFTIDEYNSDAQQNSLAVLFSDNYENNAAKWPGIIFRRHNSEVYKRLEASHSMIGVTKELRYESVDTKKVVIRRNKGVIEVSINDGEFETLINLNESKKQYFEQEATFGAGINGNGNDFRNVVATLSNMYIKMGNY